MRQLGVIIFILCGLGSVVWSKTPTAPKNDKHQFSGLKLKGQLKKPELTYIYKRKGVRAEKIVNIPEDFNEQVVRDNQKL
jgi:hypothetical protein